MKVQQLKLEQRDLDKWFYHVKLFLTPVAIIYILAIIGSITANKGAVSINDFIPNSFTLGGICLYILNSLLDYLRKINP